MSEFSWTQLARIVSTREQDPPNPTHDEVVRFFTELRTPLLRYLYTLGLPLSEGEDVAQETFLALHRHLLEGKPRDNLHGWVFRVARNLALKRLQRAATTGGEPDFHDLTDPAPNPEQQAVRTQQQRAIQSVIAALPDLDRQCLYLRAEGLRYRDIAQALDISLGSVAQALSRALDKLARAAQR
ncbi:RNA polymerase sigma factor [Paludibaculum fermentans]|uniref:Sigma-70 family RNA polymerase sigma factor n=1 Tax=Paludibaculum fermentans TaxID=1473598 RepID=A0A7S7NQ11_PALFE|nr:sigma-70 family RNA polymerase sigma factor [Paludibaculum fermentans]QOY87676.1 sigma-70 family RNA polymerase sigma factor [Paludibaculum fermentans]